jgi:hypothetical protein
LKELWYETNVLHSVAIFITQSFADKISRTPLSNPKDKDSKFARNILGLDLMEISGISNATKNKEATLEKLVALVF